jgi:hypothetical protein
MADERIGLLERPPGSPAKSNHHGWTRLGREASAPFIRPAPSNPPRRGAEGDGHFQISHRPPCSRPD